VRVDAVLTYTDLGERGDVPSATVRMVYSLLKLPDQPMAPRLADVRVGTMGYPLDDYGQDAKRPYRVQYQARWRLEKRAPEAKLSEPVTPIEIWIDPATPLKWRPWVKRGIESWNPAFEECGCR
jgi:hypothetical protein